jgi:hypothetical protein
MLRKPIAGPAAGLFLAAAFSGPALALDIVVVNTSKVDLYYTIHVDRGGGAHLEYFDMDKPLKPGQKYTMKNAMKNPPPGGKTETVKLILLDKDEENCDIPGVSFSNVTTPSVEFKVTPAHIAKCKGFADGKSDM